MPIYSSNRVYGAGSGKSIVAAEGYTENDFGRILSECAINDMRLFNAAIARDFKEAKALNEGTMVASELQAFQEFSVKEAWSGLKEKVKKLWSKIKGVFKNVYAKLSLWLNRNTKTYIAQHRKTLLNKTGLADCPIPKYTPRTAAFKSATSGFGGLKVDDLKPAVNMLNGKAMDEVIAGSDFKDMARVKTFTADHVYTKLLDVCFEKAKEGRTFGDLKMSVDTLLNNLSGSSEYLKDLRKINNETDRVFKAFLGKIDKAQKKSEDESQKNIYASASRVVSAYQNSANAMCAGLIRVIKKAISNDRGLVATLVAYNGPKTESAMLEFAYETGFDALHEETEDMTPEDVESAAEEEGINIDITVSGDVDADVTVNDETEE